MTKTVGSGSAKADPEHRNAHLLLFQEAETGLLQEQDVICLISQLVGYGIVSWWTPWSNNLVGLWGSYLGDGEVVGYDLVHLVDTGQWDWCLVGCDLAGGCWVVTLITWWTLDPTGCSLVTWWTLDIITWLVVTLVTCWTLNSEVATWRVVTLVTWC